MARAARRCNTIYLSLVLDALLARRSSPPALSSIPVLLWLARGDDMNKTDAAAAYAVSHTVLPSYLDGAALACSTSGRRTVPSCRRAVSCLLLSMATLRRAAAIADHIILLPLPADLYRDIGRRRIVRSNLLYPPSRRPLLASRVAVRRRDITTAAAYRRQTRRTTWIFCLLSLYRLLHRSRAADVANRVISR